MTAASAAAALILLGVRARAGQCFWGWPPHARCPGRNIAPKATGWLPDRGSRGANPVQCYTSEEALDEKAGEIREFLVRMGEGAKQGAVGFVIDRAYLEISFPLEED